MKNIRLYTFAVLFANIPTLKRIVFHILYMKSHDKLSSSDVKLSSKIYLLKYGPQLIPFLG